VVTDSTGPMKVNDRFMGIMEMYFEKLDDFKD